MSYEKSHRVENKADRISLFVSFALLFLISFFYFLRFENGIFFLQEKSSLFIFSLEYLEKFTIKPGGLLEYAGNFITQGYFSNMYGSLVLSLSLLIFCSLFISINKLLSGDDSYSLTLVLLPSCLLLLLQTNEEHNLHHTLGYLLTVIYFLAALVSASRRLYNIIPASFPLFFYLAGSFAFLFSLIFIVYCLAFEKGMQKYLKPAILISIVFITFFVFEGILFLRPADGLLRYPLNLYDITSLNRTEIILWGYLILFPLLVKLTLKIKSGKGSALVLPRAGLIIILALTLLSLSKQYNPERNRDLLIEKFYCDQNWDGVIEQNEKYPTKSITGQYFYNLALTEKGQLCDRMFFGRQDHGVESLTLPRSPEYKSKAAYFYYTIGLMNEAHHLAYESMVLDGCYAENLKMLVKTDLVNGNYNNAERHIDILKKTLHYRKWAQKFEKMLNMPEIVLSDPELGEKSKLIPGKDFFISHSDAENIDLMLMANPDNKKAFEYKMAWLLLEKNFRAVMYQVKRMKDFKYTRIPRHIEESMTIFLNHRDDLPYLGDLGISHETEEQFIIFLKDMQLNETEKRPDMEKIMKPGWGNTYWYYFEFR